MTEEFPQLLVVHVVAKVFDVNVCELFGSGAQLSLTLFAGFEAPHESAFKGYLKTYKCIYYNTNEVAQVITAERLRHNVNVIINDL